ncbi:MAG: hypothetical protein R3C19_14165 [Planctomycetaceae bacterium]
MAKKSDFNLSAAVREAVKANPEMSGPEIYRLLSKEQSGINKSSAAYAFSMARKALGMGSKRKKRRKVGSGAGVVKKVAKPQVDTVSFSSLKAAKQFLASNKNDLDRAIALLRQYHDLQK